MNYIKKLINTIGIGITLILISVIYLHARPAVQIDVPINSLKDGTIVRNWIILGPFPNEKIKKPITPDGSTRQGFHHDYLTEQGGESRSVWRRINQLSFEDEKGNTAIVLPQLIEAHWSGTINLKELFPDAIYKVSYAFCRIKSDKKQTVYCYLGSNDGVKVWVNGELVHSLWNEQRSITPWEDQFQISLEKGLNSILLKSDQAVFNWGFDVELFPAKPTSGRLIQVPESLYYDEGTLSKIRGREEIAFRSDIDETLQPMMIYVPNDYDSNKATPLYVDLHGGGVSYLISQIGDPNIFDEHSLQIAVCGRGHMSGYNGLGEVDILEAIEYVSKHWNVDVNRIHLGGHSMGGGGTFRLIARFPHIFASGRIWAGVNAGFPLSNMTNVPLYFLHSNDDWAAPMSMSRETMQRLSIMGAKVIWDQTHGDGHAVYGNTEAGVRSLEWVKRQSRSSQVKNIHFTAMDGLSNNAWWISILEWGQKRSYPSFKSSLANDNTLYLNFDNVAAITLDITSSPINRNEPLKIVLEGQTLETVQSPISNKLFIYWEDNKWIVAPDPPKLPKERLHVPGGANALYHGESLLVVWGTNGEKGANEKIRDFAQLARATSNPGWYDKYDQHMPYSLLPGKPDTDVTEDDISQYNLILIGTAAQNSIVSRLANDLPVFVSNRKIIASDGVFWDFTDRGLGLLYYNPLNPKRLIYWVASNEKEFYRSDLPLMSTQRQKVGAEDFQLFNAHKHQRVAGRNFDSRWRWETGYSQSPKLPDTVCSWEGFNAAMRKAIQLGTGADYVLDTMKGYKYIPRPYWAEGETRLMDVIAFAGAHTPSLGIFNLSGAEIKKQQKYFKENDINLEFSLGPEINQIDPVRTYTIGFLYWTMWDYSHFTKTNPESFRVLNSNFSYVLERYLLTSMSISKI